MSHSGKNKDQFSNGLSRRGFMQTAGVGVATLAMGSGAFALSPKSEKTQALQTTSETSKTGGPVHRNVTMFFSFSPW